MRLTQKSCQQFFSLRPGGSDGKNKVNICAPPEASLIAGSGKLVDGSGGASGTDGQVATNQDCGVKLEATPLQIVAVKFSSFDVSSSDRVDLHDGKDANDEQSAKLCDHAAMAKDADHDRSENTANPMDRKHI